MMQGELTLHSTLGEGTAPKCGYRWWRPAARTAALLAEQDQTALAARRAASGTVLVIEDHPTNQAMMAWRLQQLGVPHVLLGDGQQGWIAWRRRASTW
jgi:two-component system sensor histidine kinase EvgS